MTEKEKKELKDVKICDVPTCGKQAVVRDGDGHYLCYIHHMQWCRCIKFEKMTVET